jgi:dipeptidyl aminopeptidase/acylaminoacyl peptidase
MPDVLSVCRAGDSATLTSDPATEPAEIKSPGSRLSDFDRSLANIGAMGKPPSFDSLDDFVAIPRLTGLALAPDGSRLIAPVETLSADRKSYLSSLWQIDPGGGPARRITRAAPVTQAPVFLPDGDLLFMARHSQPPEAAGEAERVASRPGGVARAVVAAAAGTVILTGSALRGPAADDGRRRDARRESGVTAILHETLPVRHWDHDLGPGRDRLFVVEGTDEGGSWQLRDLTPDADGALEDVEPQISPDGATVFTEWRVSHPGGRESSRLVAIDVVSGALRVVAAADDRPDDQHDYSSPAVAPNGRWVAFVDSRAQTQSRPPSVTLSLVELATGEQRDLLPGFPLWPTAPVAAPDSSAVYFVADEAGHAPVWRVEVATGAVTRLTRAGAYAHLCPARDGRHLYALRDHIDSPPRPVRLEPSMVDQEPVFLDAPGDVGALPGRMEEVEARAPDGARVRGWLVLPSSGEPAPLLLWVHGGPLMSWNSWSWRWNPWLMVARGWAVLLPDPGLSRGYGEKFMQRAWGQWGPVPFADLMAITDVVEQRSDVDNAHTAAMGGSYGGYMANWIAGHTDRFQAIVSHASLWTLDRFVATTDHPDSWVMEWGLPEDNPQGYERNSPHRHANAIRTPMLVIHGDKDYRVPIGEGLALWFDLVRREVPAKLLYFPNEGHWVLTPGNQKLWYETVSAFLDHHVRGADWRRPELL